MKNKQTTFIRSMLIFSAVISTALLVACGESSPEKSKSAISPKANTLDSIQLMDTKPSDAISVKAAREQLEPGAEATVFGQIGGVDQPFLEGYAGFVLADTDIVFCDEMGEDHCPTPWDACCEDADKLKKSRASVQFVDAEGRILHESMKGFSGLSGLSHVVVQGTVASSSTPENLIIEARSLYSVQK